METSVAGHGALEREQEQEWAVRAGPHTRCGRCSDPPPPPPGTKGGARTLGLDWAVPLGVTLTAGAVGTRQPMTPNPRHFQHFIKKFLCINFLKILKLKLDPPSPAPKKKKKPTRH